MTSVLVPGLGFMGLLFGGLAIYPFLEACDHRDKRAHNIADRPRNVPVPTSLAPPASPSTVLWLAGSNDILSHTFQIGLFATTWIFRIALIVGPILAFIITKRIYLVCSVGTVRPWSTVRRAAPLRSSPVVSSSRSTRSPRRRRSRCCRAPSTRASGRCRRPWTPDGWSLPLPRLPRQAPDPAGPLVHEGQRVLRGRGPHSALHGERRTEEKASTDRRYAAHRPAEGPAGVSLSGLLCARSTPGARREGRAVVWAVAGDGRAATRGRTLGLPWAGRGRPLGGPRQRPPDRRTRVNAPRIAFPDSQAFPEVSGRGKGIRPLCPTERLRTWHEKGPRPAVRGPSPCGGAADPAYSAASACSPIVPWGRPGEPGSVRSGYRGRCWPATPPQERCPVAQAVVELQFPVGADDGRRVAHVGVLVDPPGRPQCSC